MKNLENLSSKIILNLFFLLHRRDNKKKPGTSPTLENENPNEEKEDEIDLEVELL